VGVIPEHRQKYARRVRAVRSKSHFTQRGQGRFALNARRCGHGQVPVGHWAENRHACRIRPAAAQGLKHIQQRTANRPLRSAAPVEKTDNAAHGENSLMLTRVTSVFDQGLTRFDIPRVVELSEIFGHSRYRSPWHYEGTRQAYMPRP